MTNWNAIRTACVSLCVAYRHLTFTRVSLYMINSTDLLWLHCTHFTPSFSYSSSSSFSFCWRSCSATTVFHSIFCSVSVPLSGIFACVSCNKSTENLLKYHVNIKCILSKFSFSLSIYFFDFGFGFVPCYRALLSFAFIAVNDMKLSMPAYWNVLLYCRLAALHVYRFHSYYLMHLKSKHWHLNIGRYSCNVITRFIIID